MVSVALTLMFASLIASAISDPGPEVRKCDESKNFVYKKCGPSCPASCNTPEPEQYDETCVEGCFCKDGFMLSHDSKKCVPQHLCPKVPSPCGAREQWCTCRKCDSTCENPNADCSTTKCPPVHPKCRCKPHYVRHFNGTCIPENRCPKCGVNQKLYPCNFCNPTCSNPDPICTYDCHPDRFVCGCKNGYVTASPNSKTCFPKSKCPQCPDNMKLYNCKHCDGTCDDPKPDCSKRQSESCTENGCICGCDHGFVRRDHTSQECIPVKDCFQCGENEQYYECACDLTCNSGTVCPKRECFNPGCGCKPGLYRDLNSGNCVQLDQCPNDNDK